MLSNQVLTVQQPTRQLRVCQVTGSINEHVGGPAISVTTLADVLSQQGVTSHLLTLDYAKYSQQVKVAEKIQLHSYHADLITRRFRGFHPTAHRALWKLAGELDLIHNHGLWLFPNFYARQTATKNQIPLVISPRGMLESWALRYGQFRKGLAWQFYEKQNLRSATVFHATSDAESRSIRQLGFTQPIALIPNGVDVPNLAQIPDRSVLTNRFPELASKRWLLCLARTHPKKGQDILLQIWQQLAPRFPDWHLIIAGTDIIGYQQKLIALAADLGLQHRVTFTGMLSGEHKQTALGHADLFILPTHSENFGISIAEALSYAIPVITTTGAPWRDLQHYGCGWWVDINPVALGAALEAAMGLSPTQRRDMGLTGRTLIENKYSWNRVGQQMQATYRWILEGGTAPDCIQLEPSNSH